MTSTFSPNIQLAEPANGDYADTKHTTCIAKAIAITKGYIMDKNVPSFGEGDSIKTKFDNLEEIKNDPDRNSRMLAAIETKRLEIIEDLKLKSEAISLRKRVLLDELSEINEKNGTKLRIHITEEMIDKSVDVLISQDGLQDGYVGLDFFIDTAKMMLRAGLSAHPYITAED